MAQYYEIVIFTAALQEYADQVVDQIDVNGNIKLRLYRQHTS
jgi:TFIIF-interacting CTD phosphatase-like protein